MQENRIMVLNQGAMEERTYFVEEYGTPDRTIYMLHGAVQEVDGFRDMSGFGRKRPNNVRIVWLQGRQSNRLPKRWEGRRRVPGRGWAHCDEMAKALDLDLDSEMQFFRKVYNKTKIGPNDWVCGYSNGFGAAMAFAIMFELHIFGVAFAPKELYLCKKKIIHWHGRQDGNAPFFGGESQELAYYHMAIAPLWAVIADKNVLEVYHFLNKDDEYKIIKGGHEQVLKVRGTQDDPVDHFKIWSDETRADLLKAVSA